MPRRPSVARPRGRAADPSGRSVRLTTSAPAASNASSSPSAPEPWCCTAIRLPDDALGEQELLELGRRLGLGDPVGGQARLLDRAARLRPAGDDLGAAGCAPRNSSSSPASSTASIQPRNPTPVVTTTMSGGSAISVRERAMSSSSSMCGTIVSAGARRTAAPCRSSAAVSSPGAAIDGQQDRAAREGGRDHGCGAFRTRARDRWNWRWSQGSVTCRIRHQGRQQQVGGSDMAEHHHRGVAHPGGARPRRRPSRASRASCAARRVWPLSTIATGRSGSAPAAQRRGGEAGERADAHQHDRRGLRVAQRGEGRLGRRVLAVDDVQGRRGAAVRDRDAGGLRHRRRRS